jgi:hypothetical protein
VILHPGPAAADPDSIIYRHGRRNVRLHFGGILPIVCPTADDSQFSGLAVFAGSLEEANAIMDADPAVEAACSPTRSIRCAASPGASCLANYPARAAKAGSP